MLPDESYKEYKLVAPDVDRLLNYFDRGLRNPVPLTSEILDAVKPLSQTTAPLVPTDRYGEVKSIWLQIPRGTIDDYDSFEEMKAWGEVNTYEEYKTRWLEDYPEPFAWYELVVVQSFEPDGDLRYVGVSLGNRTIVSAVTDERRFNESCGCYYHEEAAIKLCELVLPAAKDSIGLLEKGEYNALVANFLPYQFRAGVIRRSDLWESNPDVRTADYDGLSEETAQAFKELIESGANDVNKIGRMPQFTANDFFRACKVGYESIGKDCGGMTPAELYVRYSDGRDEGLTGKGHGLNEGPGIDFDDPTAWDGWYFHRPQCGGHPWEVVPGGNSTHVELYVRHDSQELEWSFRTGEITEDAYAQRLKSSGYYFVIAGTHRQYEAVNFYLALSSAGFPVIISNAEQLLARFEGSDWIGVVPHHVFTRYCEELFPEEYGDIIDFTHVYKGEDEWFERITWLPETEAKLT